MGQFLTNLLFGILWTFEHPIKAVRYVLIRLLLLLNGGRPLIENRAMHPLIRWLGFGHYITDDAAELDEAKALKMPFRATITTMNINGTIEVEILCYSAIESLAKTALENGLNDELKSFSALKPIVTRENDGTVMLHTDRWSKVFRVERASKP